jgi:hypothetical protein
MPTRANAHSAYSYSVSGSARIAGRSTVSNNSRRLTPRRRITRPFNCPSISAIAALHSASEECQVAQPAQQIELRDADSGLDFGFVLRVIRPCWQDADTIVCSHGTVTAVDLGIVE